MSGQLTRFRIEGLHHSRTYDVPINDNRLIIVGENGTGKSTIANFIYSFLTAQWERIASYEFDAILATIDGVDLSISHKEIIASNITSATGEELHSFLFVNNRYDHLLNTLLSRYE